MERRLDVSDLEPPEPMERILDALDEMPAEDCLRVRHRREPYPLYNNLIEDNQFEGNISQVVVAGGKTANRNQWQGNYWDDYQGFDRNLDGIGDTPYELYGYADRI